MSSRQYLSMHLCVDEIFYQIVTIFVFAFRNFLFLLSIFLDLLFSSISSSHFATEWVAEMKCWKYLFVLFSPLESRQKYWFLQTNLKWSWRRRRPSKWNDFKVTKAIEFMTLNNDERRKIKSIQPKKEREKNPIFVPYNVNPYGWGISYANM